MDKEAFGIGTQPYGIADKRKRNEHENNGKRARAEQTNGTGRRRIGSGPGQKKRGYLVGNVEQRAGEEGRERQGCRGQHELRQQSDQQLPFLRIHNQKRHIVHLMIQLFDEQ